MPRYIDADRLLRNTIYNPNHVPYIAESDIIFSPTADVRENVHAHWISASHDRFFKSQIYKCSKCGQILDFYGVNAGRGDANFCPNCGARMNGEDDDTD